MTMWLKPVNPPGPQFQVKVVWEKEGLICVQTRTRSWTVARQEDGRLFDTSKRGVEYRLGMPEGANDIAEEAIGNASLEIVDRFRTYQGNCRCPKCHEQKIWCTECDWCRANMVKLVADALDAAQISSCEAQPDQAIIAPMGKTTSTKKRTTKASRPKPKAKTKPKPTAKATPKKKPTSITIYDRQVFVRFDTPQIKEAVRKQAMAANLSLSAYIAAAAVRSADEGWKPELKPLEKTA